MAYPKQRIPLGNLNVDLSNFRIGEVDSSREAYRLMIQEEGGNLVNLAEDILNNGMSPAESLIVGHDPDNKGQFIVYEGNRRITALKLLQAPALTAETDIHAAFVKLGRQFSQNPITHIDCVVFPDKDTALVWIERKHTYLEGRGISPWGSPAKHRFQVHNKGVHRRSMAVIEHLDAAGKLSDSLRTALLQRTTNLDRVLQMPYFVKTLGVQIADDGQVNFGNGDLKAGNALLLDIVRILADKKFNVDKIKTKEQRKDFIDQFLDRSVLGAPEDAASAPSGKRTKADKPLTASQPKPSDAAHRITLAPRDRASKFPIRDPRLTQLYDEARRISTEDFTAAAAVLVRVFLELSTDHFLKSLKVPRPDKHKNKNWSDRNITLKEKIESALAVIDPSRSLPELKSARQGLTDNGRLHAVDELHTYVHGLQAVLVGKEVRQIWDRWHHYLRLVHQKLDESGY